MGFYYGENTSLKLKKDTLLLKLVTMRVVCCLSLVLNFPPSYFRFSPDLPIFDPETGVERWGLVLLHDHLSVFTWQDVHALCDIHSLFLGVIWYPFYKFLCSCFGFFCQVHCPMLRPSIFIHCLLLFVSHFCEGVPFFPVLPYLPMWFWRLFLTSRFDKHTPTYDCSRPNVFTSCTSSSHHQG